jgi:formimidoylglutamate deiminase
MEMLEAGYAAVGEFHYLHHAPGGAPYARLAEMSERIAAAAAQIRHRADALAGALRIWRLRPAPAGPGQIRFGNDPDRFARLLEEAQGGLAPPFPRMRGSGIAPHSLRAVSPEGLAASLELRQGGRSTCISPNRRPRWRR